MREEKLKELEDSGESTTQLVIDGKITNLEDLYEYSEEKNLMMRGSLEKEQIDFVEKWADQTENMSIEEITNVRMDTGVNELILVGMLELGINKITIGGLLNLMKKEPKYELVKRDFLNYMKHFLPPGE
jgi:hypothetical protein